MLLWQSILWLNSDRGFACREVEIVLRNMRIHFYECVGRSVSSSTSAALTTGYKRDPIPQNLMRDILQVDGVTLTFDRLSIATITPRTRGSGIDRLVKTRPLGCTLLCHWNPDGKTSEHGEYGKIYNGLYL